MMIHHLQGAHLLRWGWRGVLVDVEGFLHPRRSAPSSRPQVPPKPVASDRLKKAEQNLVLSNQFSALSEAMEPDWTIEHSIIQWNLRGFQANFEELALLSRRYKPAVSVLQETFVTSSKTPSFSGFNILTKNSLNDRATGGVALLINKSYLFSEVLLNTPLQAVAARVTLNKVVTFCSIIFLHQITLPRLIWLTQTEQLPSPFVLLGDFNGHSPVWGNESYNSRGQILEDLFSEMDLCILNLYSSRHRFHFRTGSHLWSISGPRLWVEYTWGSVRKWPLSCDPNQQRCRRGCST